MAKSKLDILDESESTINKKKLNEYLTLYNDSRNKGFWFWKGRDGSHAIENLRKLSTRQGPITYNDVYLAIKKNLHQLDETTKSGTKKVLQKIFDDFIEIKKLEAVKKKELEAKSKSTVNTKPPAPATSVISSEAAVNKVKKEYYLTKAELGALLGINPAAVSGAVVGAMITNVMFRDNSANNTMNKVLALYNDTPKDGRITLEAYKAAVKDTMRYDSDKATIEQITAVIRHERKAGERSLADMVKKYPVPVK